MALCLIISGSSFADHKLDCGGGREKACYEGLNLIFTEGRTDEFSLEEVEGLWSARCYSTYMKAEGPGFILVRKTEEGMKFMASSFDFPISHPASFFDKETEERNQYLGKVIPQYLARMTKIKAATPEQVKWVQDVSVFSSSRSGAYEMVKDQHQILTRVVRNALTMICRSTVKIQ